MGKGGRMSHAVCYEHEVFGSLDAVKENCDCKMPNPVYPSVKSFKIPDEFEEL